MQQKRKEIDENTDMGVFLFEHEVMQKIMKAQSLITRGCQLMNEGQMLMAQCYKDTIAIKTKCPESDYLLDIHSAELDNCLTPRSTNGGQIAKKQKRMKPAGPKKISGYLVFCQEMRSGDLSAFGSNRDILVHIGHEWTKLGVDEKKKYEEKAKEMNEVYAKEYEEKLQLNEKGSGESVQSQRETSPDLSVTPVKKEAATEPEAEAAAVAPAVTVTAMPTPAESGGEKKKKKKKNKHKHGDKENTPIVQQ